MPRPRAFIPVEDLHQSQIDDLVQELAMLNASIAAEEERQLDARYGEADREHAAAHAPADDFEAVHSQTIAQAIADKSVVASEEAAEPGATFGRFVKWAINFREHFAQWRDTLLDHFGMRDPGAATDRESDLDR